ncbi:Ff.00g016340.m01.CDS01 [Fusarium sp. VM40]|nr:Ff.00g016340.m01.CDS01 [Fusarium sp. VM40]
MSPISPTDVAPAVSTLVATASAFLQVYTTLDTEALSRILSDNYVLEFAPTSMNLPGPLDRDAQLARINSIKDVMSSFPVKTKHIWPNPSLRQVLVWAHSETRFFDHLKLSDKEAEWDLKGEYMFLMTMDESGEKIEHVLEFLDSKATGNIVLAVGKAMEKKKSLDVN